MNKLVFICSLGFLVACKGKPETIRPTLAPITESIYASGIVKSRNQYEVYASVSGILRDVLAEEGAVIRIGSPLFSIANTAQQLSKENAALTADFNSRRLNEVKLSEAKDAIRSAKSKFQLDSIAFVRQQILFEQGAIAKADFEQVELKVENSKYAYDASVIRYNELKRQIEFNALQTDKSLKISSAIANEYLVKSEIDGIVFAVFKSKGEMVTPQTPLAVIGSDKQFFLEMQVDEEDIVRIKKEMLVLVTLDSYRGKTFRAVVSKIVPYMNEKTRTFLVEAIFLDLPQRLFPNTTFEANILLQRKEKALLIPRNYLIDNQFVLTESGKKIRVKTGLKDFKKVEITQGISSTTVLQNPTK